jgi:hypothetical protein
LHPNCARKEGGKKNYKIIEGIKMDETAVDG